ncbi:glycoside hydrolase superfamily, partial [Zopfochytrium polystomum]
MRVLKSLLLAAAAVVSTAASTVSAGGGGSKSTSTSTTSTTTSTTAAASTPATTTIVASLSALPILTVSGSSIVEASTNRSVFLHGVNLAAKAPPFRAIDTSSPAAIAAALDPIAAAGYNVVRLAFTWEAYEGTQGVYDQNYLQYYVTLVRELRKRGVYTLVDFHQDGFSRFSLNGCGEGAPEWAVLAAG